MLLNEEEFLMDESSMLAFLADCEMANEVAPSPTDSTPTQCDALAIAWSSATSSSEKQPQAKNKSWRQRRKDEILNLREVVKQLSTDLERLKMAAGVHSTLPHSELTAPKFVLKAHKTEAALIWEKIAGRQSTLRQSSEDENAKLREAVTQHLQQAKSLQRAIKRKLREDMMSTSMDLIRQHRLATRGVAPPLNNKAVFDHLMEGMDSVYNGVNDFFAQAQMDQLPCPGRRTNKPNSTFTRGIFVQFLDNYAVPFSLRETSKVIWTPEKTRSGDDNLYFLQDFNAGTNTRMKSMFFMFSLKGLEFRVTMRYVMRKYTEQTRTVFITRTLIESEYEDLSVSLVETSRMVLKRGDLSAVGPTTVMQTHREAILHDDLSGLDQTKYPSLDFGLEQWETKITHFNNTIEDQLVRAMMILSAHVGAVLIPAAFAT